ncbi:SafA/ExsA family spore coat assembly protein [Thalassobacillus devorans]|uniref:SafA/ExsA family spore coat assembly protein n=1 Tax=Thalassobacillus devorans TaxID=279813 RepID=UPI0004B760A3|nr:SafA/ExsA family spore coat assembly protein [Thalassobacillus devorans]
MRIHIVQKGDTLWKIAQKYGVDFEQLKQMNTQLSNPDMIMPGMKIKVPTGSKQVKKEAPMKKEQPKAAPQVPYKKETPKPIPQIKEDEKEMPMMPPMQQMQPIQMPMMEQQLQNYYTTFHLPQMPYTPPAPPKKEKVKEAEESPEPVKEMPQVQPMMHHPMPLCPPGYYPVFCPPMPCPPMPHGQLVHSDFYCDDDMESPKQAGAYHGGPMPQVQGMWMDDDESAAMPQQMPMSDDCGCGGGKSGAMPMWGHHMQPQMMPGYHAQPHYGMPQQMPYQGQQAQMMPQGQGMPYQGAQMMPQGQGMPYQQSGMPMMQQGMPQHQQMMPWGGQQMGYAPPGQTFQGGMPGQMPYSYDFDDDDDE